MQYQKTGVCGGDAALCQITLNTCLVVDVVQRVLYFTILHDSYLMYANSMETVQ